MPADRAMSTKVTGSPENEWQRGPVTNVRPIEPMYFRQSRLDNIIGIFVPDDCFLRCLAKNTSVIAEKERLPLGFQAICGRARYATPGWQENLVDNSSE